jgi:outer membrane biosynthesis protein TonB
MKIWYVPALAGLVLASICATAHAQAPSKAQQDAIRSNCRSDFMRNCSSVTPGGREALDCLMQNKAKVSGGCQGALNAISAPAAAKPEPKPEPKTAAPRPEPTPTAAAPAAPAAPTAPAEPAPKRAKPEPKAKPAPRTVATPARPAPPAVPQPTAPAPAAVAAPPPPAQQPKLGEAILIRRFCTTDFRVLCKGVPLGQGRAIQCLANNGPALSPGCRDVMIKTGELR